MTLMALIQLLLAVVVLIVMLRFILGGPHEGGWLGTARPLLPWLIIVAVIWFLIKNLDLFSFLNEIRL